jgi:hypothetical protein
MIEQEILEIVEDQADDGERLNEIVDQFRRGRDVSDLVVLLDSINTEFVSIGAWILGELPFERYSVDEIVSRLHKLTNHTEPAIRLSAFGALFPALSSKEAATQTLIRKLLDDPNPGVRSAAEAGAVRLSLKK